MRTLLFPPRHLQEGIPPKDVVLEDCDVTGNVHRTWAAFLCGYPLLPYFFPQKPHNATLFYRGTRIQGRRHLVTAAPSLQSCTYRSLRVTIKLDSAAI